MTDLTRRGALAAAPALTAAACASTPGIAADLQWMDATETAARIRSRDVSAAEVVGAAIARAEALNPKLNFLVTPDFDRARAKAAGPVRESFGGVPYLIKDLDDYAGLPTRFGSRAYATAVAADGQPPLISAYDNAGLIVIGKSSSPEQGYLPTTEPLGSPPTRNPWDLSRSSGGSSGGAAAAVAAGVVPVAHATDGGGSIRIPASNCGLFGLKPSRGRMLPFDRIPGQAPPVDISVQHCVSRSVRDSAALFAASERTGAAAILPPVNMVTAPSDRKLRVGLLLVTGEGMAPDPEVAAAIQATARLLESMGHGIEPTAWPMSGKQFSDDFLAYWASGAAIDNDKVRLRLGREPTEADLEPFTLGMGRLVARTPPAELGAAVQRLAAFGGVYDRWFERFDVILSPVLRTPAPPLGYVRGDVEFETLRKRLFEYVGYTPPHNVAGAPAMSVPLYWTAAGLPIGSQFAARVGGERTLFELAYALERAQPWAPRRPVLQG